MRRTICALVGASLAALILSGCEYDYGYHRGYYDRGYYGGDYHNGYYGDYHNGYYHDRYYRGDCDDRDDC